MATLESYVASDLPRLGRLIRSTIDNRGIVALPTETFYGLAVNPFDAQAVDRLLQVKGREDGKPLLVLIGDRSQLPLLAAEISPVADLLMEHFWPGALTILFPAQASLPANLTAGSGVVGVRLSSSHPLRELLKLTGPLTGTSANRARKVPAATAEEVRVALARDIDLIIDGGRTSGGLPSTVIDPGQPVRLIREGAVPRQTIQNVLQTRGLSLV